MKRFGSIMPMIASWSNMAAAFHQAAAGKQHQRQVEIFRANLDLNLSRLLRELENGNWCPGEYERFTVRDPKLRIIHAAPFADRVVHHALMRVAGPLLERRALPHSHACRIGKGNLAAVHYAAECTRKHKFFLKLDIRRYFDSIEHSTLLELLRGRFKDGQFLELIRRIIHSFSHSTGRGLPIGTLVSQYLANAYLDDLDRWIVEDLKAPGYVRYMDDFVLWHDDPSVLADGLDGVRSWLGGRRSLEIKPESRPLECRSGVSFLGYRITPNGILLGKRARRRFSARLLELETGHERGHLDMPQLQRRVDSLLAFTDIACCREWRRRVLGFPSSSEPQARTASCAAAPGTTRRRTAAPPTATGTTRVTGTTTWDCACPQLTRNAEAARLTRSPELPFSEGQAPEPPGAGRDDSRRLPNAPGGQPANETSVSPT